MDMALPIEQLEKLVVKQLTNLFIFNPEKETTTLKMAIQKTLKKVEYCFSYNGNKYYSKNNQTFFDPFHSAQYSIFLYYLSNIIFKEFQHGDLAKRIYYLNKALNGVDLYFEIELPEIFSLDHPVGSVMGRAKYSNFFSFGQNCTVGNNKGIYPQFEENITLFSGATVIGNSHIGKNCFISANTYIKDENIPKNSIVFGSSPNLTIKTEEESYFQYIWKQKNLQ